MNKELRKIENRTERHKVRAETKKFSNPTWLEKWLDEVDAEMATVQDIESYVKKAKVGKAKRKR